MSDTERELDLSKYFTRAHGLLSELEADAVVVLVAGGRLGNGCAPALVLDPKDSPAARQRNTRLVKLVARTLEMVAARLEADIRKSGMPMEPPG